jgi:hypothetical protein
MFSMLPVRQKRLMAKGRSMEILRTATPGTESGGFVVEAMGLEIAHGCVERGGDAEKDDLSGVILQRHRGQLCVQNGEVRSGIAGFDLRSHQSDRISFHGDDSGTFHGKRPPAL